MEGCRSHIISPADRIYLARACELAARGIGNVSPNPPVGAVIVDSERRIIGEGFHHVRGGPHAEVEALQDAHRRGHAQALAGATIYVSLEPCNHYGRTPPCSEALVAAQIGRVVIGALDPNPRTALGGVKRLEDAGITVDIVDDAAAAELIRRFSRAVQLQRPYVTLKMAASLDGRIGPQPGSFWLTGKEARHFVHDLRYEHDAVMVGAHTVACDDPLLTIRPVRARRRFFTRVVICGATPPPRDAQIFQPAPMTNTLLMVPGAFAPAYTAYADTAETIVIGGHEAQRIDLGATFDALYKRDIASVLCEGGPTFAGALLHAGFVDRIEWILTPRLLTTASAPTALVGNIASGVPNFRFDHVTPLGEDLRITVDLARSL